MSQRKPGRRSENSSNFNNSSKEIAPRLAYCEGIAISTKHFTFLKLPVFSTKVTERFKINPDPIGKDGGATRHQFSPTGEPVRLYGASLRAMDYRWEVTNIGRRSPGRRVPMVAQIHRRNVDTVKAV